MKPSEAPKLIDLWSIARYDLRLSDAEFYELTPRQFAKLYERHLDARRHIELIVAYNTAAVINTSDYRPKEAIAPRVFMPSVFEQRTSAPPPKRKTRARIAAEVGGLMRGLAVASNRN